jgi:hypothetical protein
MEAVRALPLHPFKCKHPSLEKDLSKKGYESELLACCEDPHMREFMQYHPSVDYGV